MIIVNPNDSSSNLTVDGADQGTKGVKVDGVNYTYFFDEKIPSSSLLSQSGDNVNLERSWGWAAQMGMDVTLNQDWFVNMDVKYLDIDTTARFKSTAAGNAKINVDIDPYYLWYWSTLLTTFKGNLPCL